MVDLAQPADHVCARRTAGENGKQESPPSLGELGEVEGRRCRAAGGVPRGRGDASNGRQDHEELHRLPQWVA